MMPLSVDLRSRVIATVDKGTHKNEVGKLFNVSPRVIYNWLKLRKETNSLNPKSGYQNGHKHKITDWESFKIFADKNKHKTLKEMTIEWQKLYHTTISTSVMCRALKKIGYTSKKKLFPMLKQMKKKERNF